MIFQLWIPDSCQPSPLSCPLEAKPGPLILDSVSRAQLQSLTRKPVCPHMAENLPGTGLPACQDERDHFAWKGVLQPSSPHEYSALITQVSQLYVSVAPQSSVFAHTAHHSCIQCQAPFWRERKIQCLHYAWATQNFSWRLRKTQPSPHLYPPLLKIWAIWYNHI